MTEGMRDHAGASSGIGSEGCEFWGTDDLETLPGVGLNPFSRTEQPTVNHVEIEGEDRATASFAGGIRLEMQEVEGEWRVDNLILVDDDRARQNRDFWEDFNPDDLGEE